MTITLLLMLAALAPMAVAGAQTDPVVESRAHYRPAVAAYEARDLPSFLLRVDLWGKSVSLVEAADSVLALAIDGLYYRRDEPTLGVLVDGELYYIANAQR